MRIALAVFMALHAVAHLPGLVVGWRLATLQEMPYHTAVLGGRLDLGDAGMRTMGALWLLAAIGFALAAAGALLIRAWWTALATTAVGLSLVLTLLEWPVSSIGVIVNLLILTALALGRRTGALAVQ